MCVSLKHTAVVIMNNQTLNWVLLQNSQRKKTERYLDFRFSIANYFEVDEHLMAFYVKLAAS